MKRPINLVLILAFGLALPSPRMTYAQDEDPPTQQDVASPKDESSTQTKNDTASSHQQSATQVAGDPTAPIIQFQIQNTVVPSNYGGEGAANYFQLQPVIPIPKTKGIRYPQLARLVLPLLLTSPNPDRTTGIGDMVISDQLIVKRSAALSVGVGAVVVFPTASDERLGQGKYQIGPSVSLISQASKKWQIGIIVQDQISFAGDPDRPDVHQLDVQPIVNYVAGKWYFGVGDFTTTFDWENGGAVTIPVAFQAGYVTKIGKYFYNFSIEPFKMVAHDGPSANWGVRFGFVMLLPEHFK